MPDEEKPNENATESATQSVQVNEPLTFGAPTMSEDTLTEQYQAAQKKQDEQKEGNEQKGKDDKDKQKEGFKQKFKVRLERLSRLIADAEKAAYSHLGVKYKDAYYQETLEDTDLIIANRFEVVSEYGDIINLVLFDFVGHAVDAAAEVVIEDRKQKEGNEQQQGVSDNKARSNKASDYMSGKTRFY